MIRTTSRRIATIGCAAVAGLLGAMPAAAASPTVDSWTVHVERPFIPCDGFETRGVWDISHRLTLFTDSTGVPIRDIERVDYVGEIVNATTGASVPDSGLRIFFDTLAPDGSFLTTYAVDVRHSAYIHTAVRTDFQTGGSVGHDGFTDAGIAALCDALGG